MLTALAAGGAFAQEFATEKSYVSAGCGLMFGLNMITGSDGGSIGRIGAFGFFDVTYAEMNAAFFYYDITGDDVAGIGVSYALFGKWPFKLGIMQISPLAGVRLIIPITHKTYSGFNYADWSNIGLQLGANLDYPLKGSWYLRTSTLFSICFKPSDSYFDDFHTVYTFGQTFKISIGYKL